MLGASLNDTFDGDGAAELGATIDNGGDTDMPRTVYHAVGGGEAAQVELPLGALGSGLATRRTLSYREVLEHQNTRTPGRNVALSSPLPPSAQDHLGVRSLDEAGRLHFAEHSWTHYGGMFAPTQRTRRFFDAHIAPHLTLTAADAARCL